VSDGLQQRLQSLLPGEALSTWRREDGLELPLAAPDSLDGWIELMRLARAEGLRVLPIGRGTKLAWCRPAERVDLVLSTRRWKGILAYQPDEGTLSARSGEDWASLSVRVAEGGHHLAPELPRPARVSLGGVLAAGEQGIDRLRHESVRASLLGMRVLLADGTLASSGAPLVKNVTGYAMQRLYCGSHGSLCVILEAALRLWPLPRARAALQHSFATRAAALQAAHALLELPVRPTCVLAHDLEGGDGWTLEILLAGREEVVEWECERIAALLPELRVHAGREAEPVWERLREREGEHGAALALACLPSQLDKALERLLSWLEDCGLEVRCSVQPGIASAILRLGAPEVLEGADLDRLLQVRKALPLAPAQLRWRSLPFSVRAWADTPSPPGAALGLMRGIKRALDPDGTFAPGRLHELL
jgi:glycolate oxidase FAD binding subunit